MVFRVCSYRASQGEALLLAFVSIPCFFSLEEHRRAPPSKPCPPLESPAESEIWYICCFFQHLCSHQSPILLTLSPLTGNLSGEDAGLRRRGKGFRRGWEERARRGSSGNRRLVRNLQSTGAGKGVTCKPARGLRTLTRNQCQPDHNPSLDFSWSGLQRYCLRLGAAPVQSGGVGGGREDRCGCATLLVAMARSRCPGCVVAPCWSPTGEA
jgi:hypothetical protein